MDTIKLSDGRETVVESAYLSSSGKMLVRVRMSMAEAVAFFATGTDAIIYNSEEEGFSASGYTEIEYVSNDGDYVIVALRRPMR